MKLLIGRLCGLHVLDLPFEKKNKLQSEEIRAFCMTVQEIGPHCGNGGDKK